MKWSKKIIHCKEDLNLSKMTSRSLSKFRKVDLQKSQLDISSHNNLERSQLKLHSVQKMKPQYLNKSYISNYMNMSRHNEFSIKDKIQSINTNSYKIKNFADEKQKNYFIQTSNSQRKLMSNPVNMQSHRTLQNQQGYSLFNQTSPKIQNFSESLKISSIKSQNISLQDKFKQIIEGFNKLVFELKQILENIKKQLNKNTLSNFMEIENDLQLYLKSFQSNLSIQINKIILLKEKKNTMNSQKHIYELQNDCVNEKFQYKKNIESENFIKLKSFDEQCTIEQPLKQQISNRPNSFKNRFKALIGNSGDPITKKQNQQVQQSENRKILRKRTNPSPRVNSFIGTDSRMKESEGGDLLKYQRIRDRSASKSVRQLQEKILSIKKFINLGTQNTNDEQSFKAIRPENLNYY